jgi:hypothetical protein
MNHPPTLSKVQLSALLNFHCFTKTVPVPCSISPKLCRFRLGLLKKVVENLLIFNFVNWLILKFELVCELQSQEVATVSALGMLQLLQSNVSTFQKFWN